MSFEALAWAFRQDVKNPEKAVLIALAYRDNHDAPHGCFPALDTVAHDCGIHRVTVVNCLKSLIKSGLVKREIRLDDMGRNRSSFYTLPLAWSRVADDYPRVADGNPSVAHDYPGRVADDYPERCSSFVTGIERKNLNTTRIRERHSNSGKQLHFSGTKLRITTEEHQVFTKAFEGTDLAAEYLKMDSWLVANHRNYRAFGRFANTWLSRVKIPHLGGSNGESAHLARTKRTLETARRMLESANGRAGEISLTLSPGTN